MEQKKSQRVLPRSYPSYLRAFVLRTINENVSEEMELNMRQYVEDAADRGPCFSKKCPEWGDDFLQNNMNILFEVDDDLMLLMCNILSECSVIREKKECASLSGPRMAGSIFKFPCYLKGIKFLRRSHSYWSEMLTLIISYIKDQTSLPSIVNIVQKDGRGTQFLDKPPTQIFALSGACRNFLRLFRNHETIPSDSKVRIFSNQKISYELLKTGTLYTNSCIWGHTYPFWNFDNDEKFVRLDITVPKGVHLGHATNLYSLCFGTNLQNSSTHHTIILPPGKLSVTKVLKNVPSPDLYKLENPANGGDDKMEMSTSSFAYLTIVKCHFEAMANIHDIIVDEDYDMPEPDESEFDESYIEKLIQKQEEKERKHELRLIKNVKNIKSRIK